MSGVGEGVLVIGSLGVGGSASGLGDGDRNTRGDGPRGWTRTSDTRFYRPLPWPLGYPGIDRQGYSSREAGPRMGSGYPDSGSVRSSRPAAAADARESFTSTTGTPRASSTDAAMAARNPWAQCT